MSIVFIIQLAASFFMTGLIWFVQLVHYPLFDKVGFNAFPQFHAEHTRRTSVVVMPVMLIELVTGVWLILLYHDGWGGICSRIIVLLLIAIWLSTFLVQVPVHGRLGIFFQRFFYDRLVRSNWIRTIAWTIKSGLLLSML